jgi:hypothetical protein
MKVDSREGDNKSTTYSRESLDVEQGKECTVRKTLRECAWKEAKPMPRSTTMISPPVSTKPCNN